MTALSNSAKELRSTLDAELRQALADIEEQARRERLIIDGKWYIPVRDLQLQVYALGSQVDTYKPFPASPAYIISLERLAGNAPRDKAVAQQAQELAAVDARLKQRLADARTAIGERFSRQIADYRSSLRKSRGRVRKIAAMQEVLSALEPLERPAVPPAPEMRAMTIPSPAQIAASAGSHSAPLKTEAEIAAMKQQRARLAQYLEKDVKRRLNRLATQHRWRLAFGPKQDPRRHHVYCGQIPCGRMDALIASATETVHGSKQRNDGR